MANRWVKTSQKRRKPLWTDVFMASLVLTLVTGCSAGNNAKTSEVQAPDYWPTTEWKSATPESQGMDSAKINEMFENMTMHGLDIHHVLIIRNGYKVAESNPYPYQPDTLHVINSITKDFTSALVGKAIDEGLIKNINQPVLSFFPNRKVENTSDFKSSLTLKNLLTMTAGFDWSEDGNYGADYDSNTQMWRSENQIQFMLDRPVKEKPGSKFYYTSGASHLMSGILSQVTGKTSNEYAQEKLLGPIGVKDIVWALDNQGINSGGSRLFISPEDLAKFGFLYLHGGKWDGAQILSQSWVSESTSKQIETPNGLAGRSGYGYQWWMNPFGGYSGRGYAGQYLFVMPEQNMVVVFNSSLKGSDYFMPETLVGNYLLPAIKSEAEIPENAAAYASLMKTISSMENPPIATAPAPLPEVAKTVSGKVFKLEKGETVGLEFSTGTSDTLVAGDSNEATLHWFTDGDQYDVAVGLDNVYRFGDCPNFFMKGLVSKVGFRGAWKDEKTFVVEIRPLEADDSYTLSLTFENGTVEKTFVSGLTGR